MKPSVSVIMSVYNGERYLRAAIDSVLTQTFTDYELIVIDDASTDRSTAILAEYAARDARLVLLRNETNLGLTKSLNIGLQAARGWYIARQDADDISLPSRFSRQVQYLDEHRETQLLGTQCIYIDAHGTRIGETRHPISDITIRWCFLADNAIAHPSAMFRRALIEHTGLYYDTSLRYAQDYDLWVRMAEHGGVANLDEPLIQYRIHPASISLQRRQEQQAIANQIATRQLVRLLPELEQQPDQTETLRNLVFGQPVHTPEDRALIEKLLHAFRTQHQLSIQQYQTLRRYSVQRMLNTLRDTTQWWSSPVLWQLARLDGGSVTRYIIAHAVHKGLRAIRVVR